MSSDDEDYMSANFVVESTTQDVRPGLLHNRNHQRSFNMHKKKVENDAKNRNDYRPKKVIEAERREEGLQEAIGSNNKGFAMLEKMGYKQGTAIGKTGEGRVEPIPIQLKSDRQGLGRAAALHEVKMQKRAIRCKRQQDKEHELTTPEQFRARMILKTTERLVQVDLHKSQKACFQLDSDEGHEKPAEPWFWPESVLDSKKSVKKEFEVEDWVKGETKVPSEISSHTPLVAESSEDEEEIDDDFQPSEKLEMLTKYLRSSYNYCTWCCVKYEDEKDMQDECPGTTREDH